MSKLNSEKLLNELNKKWKNKSCCMCGHNKWTIDNNIVSPMTLGDNGDIQLGGRIMPLVAVTCEYCGNVIFVNPLAVDAIEKETADK